MIAAPRKAEATGKPVHTQRLKIKLRLRSPTRRWVASCARLGRRVAVCDESRRSAFNLPKCYPPRSFESTRRNMPGAEACSCALVVGEIGGAT